MAISGVGQSYYQNNVATTKSTKSVNSTEETGNTKELSEAEEMAIFKKEFYAEIDNSFVLPVSSVLFTLFVLFVVATLF